MNKIFQIFILTAILGSQTCYSQESWSLDKCISYALKNNLELRSMDLKIESASEQEKQSLRSFLPSIGINSNYNVQYGRSIDPNNNTIVSSDFFSNNYGVNANLNLFEGFKKINERTSAKFILTATVHDRTQQKYLLAFRIMGSYYEVQLYDGLCNLDLEQMKISLQNLEFVVRQLELGLKSKADLKQAEAVLISDQLKLKKSTNLLNAASLTLSQDMNYSTDSLIVLNKLDEKYLPNLSSKNIKSSDVLKTALEGMPSLKSQELKVDAANKQIASCKSNRYPSLNLFAGYGTGYYETNKNTEGDIIPFNQQRKNNASQIIGLSLNFQISDRGISRNDIKQKQINFYQAENELEIQKQIMHKTIAATIQTYESLLIEYEISTKNESAQQINFDMKQSQFENGLISMAEVRQSQMEAAIASNQKIQTQLRLKVLEETIKFYQGISSININN